MNCYIALILSPSNKAQCIADDGATLVVEKHWTPDEYHYSAWRIKRTEIYSYNTTNMTELDAQIKVWQASLDGDYWRIIG